MVVILTALGLFMVYKVGREVRRNRRTVKACASSAAFREALGGELEKKSREAQKARKAAEAAERARKREQAKAEAQRVQRIVASSDLEHLNHKRERLYKLIKIAEDSQAGTTHGGKEWIKYERQIMAYEDQIHALDRREIKARSARDA